MPTTRVSAEAIKEWHNEGVLCWSIEDAIKDADTCSRETGRPADCYFREYLDMAKADKTKGVNFTGDVETIALSAITFTLAVEVLAANQDRANRGETAAYNGVIGDWTRALEEKIRNGNPRYTNLGS